MVRCWRVSKSALGTRDTSPETDLIMVRSYDKEDCPFPVAGNFPSSARANLAEEDGNDRLPPKDHQIVEHATSECPSTMKDHG